MAFELQSYTAWPCEIWTDWKNMLTTPTYPARSFIGPIHILTSQQWWWWWW